MAIKFSPGPCGCCNPECCIGGTVSSVVIQLSGVADGSCTGCGGMNGTYALQVLPDSAACTFSIKLPPPFTTCSLNRIDLTIATDSVNATLAIGFSAPRFQKNFPSGLKCADLPGTVIPFLLGQQLCNLMGATITILGINP